MNIPLNPRNPWLIIRVLRALRGKTAKKTEQLPRYDTKLTKNMQDKANLEIDPMVVTKVLTKNYDKKTLGAHGKNKAKTKPNKANSKPILCETNPIQTQFHHQKPLPIFFNFPPIFQFLSTHREPDFFYLLLFPAIKILYTASYSVSID